MSSMGDVFSDQPLERVMGFLRILGGNFFTVRHLDAVMRSNTLTRDWVWKLDELMEPIETRARFDTAPQMYGAFRDRAETLGWPFSQKVLDQLWRDRPCNFTSKMDNVLTLQIWLGDLEPTFVALRDWVYANHEVNPNEECELKADPDHLRLRFPECFGTKPVVRWGRIDLLANRGKDMRFGISPSSICTSRSAGVEVLSTAALHPGWVEAASQITEGTWMPGLVVKVGTDDQVDGGWWDTPTFLPSGHVRKHHYVRVSHNGGGVQNQPSPTFVPLPHEN